MFNFIILPQNYDLLHFHNILILPNINKAEKLLKWKCFSLLQYKQQKKKKPYSSNIHQLFNLSVWSTENGSFLSSMHAHIHTTPAQTGRAHGFRQ